MIDDPQADLREHYRVRRRRLGISQAELARQLGITYRRMWWLENRGRIKPDMRQRLDVALGELERELSQ